MTWDPAGLEIHSVTPKQISADDLDVPITVAGAGFSGSMRAVLVASSSSLERRSVIPCNGLAVKPSTEEVTARICPKKKLAGSYDLIFWLSPPAEVVDANDKPIPDVPVNDVCVLKDAITVTASRG